MVLTYGVLSWMGRSAPLAWARSFRRSRRNAARSGPSWSRTLSRASNHSAVSWGSKSATLSFSFWCMDILIIRGEPLPGLVRNTRRVRRVRDAEEAIVDPAAGTGRLRADAAVRSGVDQALPGSGERQFPAAFERAVPGRERIPEEAAAERQRNPRRPGLYGGRCRLDGHGVL